MGNRTCVRKAFAGIDAVVMAGVIGLVCCVAVVGGQHSRKQAGLTGSLANLKKIGEVGASYAADFDDHVWSFSWVPGANDSEYEDLQNPNNGVVAAMYQSTDIVRRLSGNDAVPRLERLPNFLFTSTLVLADYLGESLPAEWMVSPGDEVRLGWQADPDNPPDLDDNEARSFIFGVYGSSYGLPPAFWAPDEATQNQNTVYQYRPQHDLLLYPPINIGGRRVSEISFPAQKVQLAERESYFFGVRPVFYLHPSARVPLMMADGSASPRVTADANKSFRPSNPNSDRETLLDYRPRPIYETPTLSGEERDEDIKGKYKWTRRGLRGIDFSGERAE